MGRSDRYKGAFEISFVNPNSGNNPSGNNPSGNNPSGNNPSGNNKNNNQSTSSNGGGWFDYNTYKTAAPNSESVHNKVLSSYDSNAQAAARTTNANNQDIVFNAFNDNRMQKVDPDVHRNHAKDPTNGTLNGKSFDDTMYASRSADAYNNRRHLKYGTSGSDTRSYGSIAASNIGTERYEPIETQEMRQMRANEDIDLKAREAQEARSEAVKNYKLELQRLIDGNKAAFAQLQDTTGINLERLIQQAVHTAEYSQTYAQYLNNMNTLFTQYLDNDIRMRVASILSQSSYVFMYCYMNGLGIDAATKAKNNLLDSVAKGLSPEEATVVTTATNTMLGAYDYYASIDAFMSAARNSLPR